MELPTINLLANLQYKHLLHNSKLTKTLPVCLGIQQVTLQCCRPTFSMNTIVTL